MQRALSSMPPARRASSDESSTRRRKPGRACARASPGEPHARAPAPSYSLSQCTCELRTVLRRRGHAGPATPVLPRGKGKGGRKHRPGRYGFWTRASSPALARPFSRIRIVRWSESHASPRSRSPALNRAEEERTGLPVIHAGSRGEHLEPGRWVRPRAPRRNPAVRGAPELKLRHGRDATPLLANVNVLQ